MRTESEIRRKGGEGGEVDSSRRICRRRNSVVVARLCTLYREERKVVPAAQRDKLKRHLKRVLNISGVAWRELATGRCPHVNYGLHCTSYVFVVRDQKDQ